MPIRRLATLLALLAPLFCNPAHAARETAEEMLMLMGLTDVKDITFLDARKQPIDKEMFAQRRATGFKIEKTKLPDGELKVVLTLLTRAEGDPEYAKRLAAGYAVKPGAPFLPVQLTQLDGVAFDNKALTGRHTVINFFFAACAPCIAEVPQLNAIAKSRPDINFVALTFDADKVAQKFLDQYKFSWKIVPNAKKVNEDLGIHSYPTFAIIDDKGVLKAIGNRGQIGTTDKSLEAWVARLAPAVQ